MVECTIWAGGEKQQTRINRYYMNVIEHDILTCSYAIDRFVPPSIIKEFDLQLPPYGGTDQVSLRS